MRNASSTITSASAKPAATSPLTSRKRWQTFVPGSGRTPIETASLGRVGRAGMQQHGAGRDGLDGVEDGGQLLVVDLDQPRRGAGLLARLGGDGGDDVAGVARDVGEHALVARLAAVEPEVGDVLGRQRDAAVGQRRDVDAHHARVRVRRAHERGVQHARALDVDRVALRAGDAASMPMALIASASIARRTSTAVTRRR